MGFFKNWFRQGSYENYDEGPSREDYLEQQDAQDGDREESTASEVTGLCAKCGGSGIFQGTTSYGGGPLVRGTCPQCNGTGVVQALNTYPGSE